MINGKKTYSVVIAAILTAVGAYLAGEIDVAKLVEAVLLALGVAGIRHGVSTETAKPRAIRS